MWCVGELDEEYIEKMEDVLAVYERPYSAAHPVVCLDEKPVSLHADVRPVRPMVPGHGIRRDNEYKRNGTANIFAAVEPKAGRHFTRATPDRSGPGRLPLEPPQSPLHTQTRKLAQSGRNRTQPHLPPVPRQAPDSLSRTVTV